MLPSSVYYSDEAIAAFLETAGEPLKELSLNNVRKVSLLIPFLRCGLCVYLRFFLRNCSTWYCNCPSVALYAYYFKDWFESFLNWFLREFHMRKFCIAIAWIPYMLDYLFWIPIFYQARVITCFIFSLVGVKGFLGVKSILSRFLIGLFVTFS